MKVNTLFAVITSLTVLASSAAMAQSTDKHQAQQHQFMAKRPYAQMVAKTEKVDAGWEAASFVAEENAMQEIHQKQQHNVRVNMLARRAF